MKLPWREGLTALDLSGRPNVDDPALKQWLTQFVELGQILLTILARYRWDIEEIKTAEFIALVEDWRAKLGTLETPQELEKLQSRLYQKCDGHLKREKAYLEEREVELKNMISILSQAVSTVSVENGEYHRQLLDSSQNLSRISQLEDIKRMRALLSETVQQLTETVRQKQERERQQFEHLEQYAEALKAKLQTAVNRSLRDPLTGVFNRQGWDQQLESACKSAGKTNNPFALAVIDVDNFKQINDRSGHQVGDSVLSKLGEIFKASFRAEDFIARYGGDEFGVLLPANSLDKARVRLDKLCKAVAQETYYCSAGSKETYLKVSLSCGLSYYRQGDTPESLFRRADDSLYLAKKSGRNQVRTQDELPQR